MGDSVSPSVSPSTSSSKSPSVSPSRSPSISPSVSPSISPSKSPSSSPSVSPSSSPSISPSKSPSKSPSVSPSKSPSKSPSASPSISPSQSPSKSPSSSPSASPSQMPETQVTYTVRSRVKIQKKYIVTAKLAFGDGTNTLYPSGGITIIPNKLGLFRFIDSFKVMESNGDGLLYEFDRSAVKLRILYPTQETGSNAGRAALELTAGTTVLNATSLEVEVMGW